MIKLIMGSANESWHYFKTPSPISWAHNQMAFEGLNIQIYVLSLVLKIKSTDVPSLYLIKIKRCIHMLLLFQSYCDLQVLKVDETVTHGKARLAHPAVAPFTKMV